MYISSEGLLIILVVGVIAGWLASDWSAISLSEQVGAFIGVWLLPQLGVHLGAGLVAAIANATIGAIILLFVVRAARGGGLLGGRGRW